MSLQQRAACITAAITQELCDPFIGCSFVPPQGGYFAWVQLPEDVSANDVFRVASERHRVKFLPGPRTGDLPQLQRMVRLSFSYYEPDDLRTGVSRLRDAIVDVRAGK